MTSEANSDTACDNPKAPKETLLDAKNSDNPPPAEPQEAANQKSEKPPPAEEVEPPAKKARKAGAAAVVAPPQPSFVSKALAKVVMLGDLKGRQKRKLSDFWSTSCVQTIAALKSSLESLGAAVGYELDDFEIPAVVKIQTNKGVDIPVFRKMRAAKEEMEGAMEAFALCSQARFQRSCFALRITRGMLERPWAPDIS